MKGTMPFSSRPVLGVSRTKTIFQSFKVFGVDRVWGALALVCGDSQHRRKNVHRHSARRREGKYEKYTWKRINISDASRRQLGGAGRSVALRPITVASSRGQRRNKSFRAVNGISAAFNNITHYKKSHGQKK
ncbi:hypothetical protein E2C01_029157 [Portunus trituberculatus]|uniref:Uncharacterized protein n=1 Tax=Portunus trituberculatus TaxID=210409 RepID=A0A5B7ES23_PORTR|nr:hypothetical protein [Portunus trituberculatus]